MANSNDFHSLLSVFRDATTSSSSRTVNPNITSAATKSSGGGERQQRSAASHKKNGKTQPLSDTTSKSPIDPASTKDPSFSAPLLKERIERILRIQQIRQSTSNNNAKHDNSGFVQTKSSVKIAICATIVDEFPHEVLWRKWMEETGGEFTVADNDETCEKSNTVGKGEKFDGEEAEQNESESMKLISHAELYVHAKNPECVRSEWLRSKTLPISHRPNWNDVRIVRAIISLLEAALRDELTTHILLCTESCIPVATLAETARSVLLDEFCPWDEMKDGHVGEMKQGSQQRRMCNQRRVDWNRSYVDCYDRNSSRCTRFDEREFAVVHDDILVTFCLWHYNCWGILKDSVPGETIFKALPGWCLLSRKHAQSILDIPSQLEGSNLWPAFERVWAPEEVFIPTALAICGHMDEVSQRALTHSQWDERAANHKDRAHPLSYDGCFDDGLVSRVRRDGCLFLRKIKTPLDVNVWEQIVVQRKKGQDMGTTAMKPEQESRRGRDWEMERGGRGEGGRGGGQRYHNRGDRSDRSYHSRPGYDSRRNYDSRRRHDDDQQRHKRDRTDRSSRDSSWKRQRSRW
ncbi:hypothetical protein ACHAXR_002806 [Thalassiosira sp. AJA248-18]